MRFVPLFALRSVPSRASLRKAAFAALFLAGALLVAACLMGACCRASRFATSATAQRPTAPMPRAPTAQSVIRFTPVDGGKASSLSTSCTRSRERPPAGCMSGALGPPPGAILPMPYWHRPSGRPPPGPSG